MSYVPHSPSAITIIAGHIINTEYGLPYFIDGKPNPDVDIYAPKQPLKKRSFNIYVPYIDYDVFIDRLTLATNELAQAVQYYQHPNIANAIKRNDLVMYAESNGETTYISRNSGRCFYANKPDTIIFRWTIEWISNMGSCDTLYILYDKYNVYNDGTSTYMGINIQNSDNTITFDNTYKNAVLATYYGAMVNMSLRKAVAYTKSINGGRCCRCNKQLCEVCFDYFENLYCPACYRKKIAHKTKYYTIYDVATKYSDLLIAEQTVRSTQLLDIYNSKTTVQELTGPDFTYTVLIMGSQGQYLGVLDDLYRNLDLSTIPNFNRITQIIPCKLYA